MKNAPKNAKTSPTNKTVAVELGGGVDLFVAFESTLNVNFCVLALVPHCNWFVQSDGHG